MSAPAAQQVRRMTVAEFLVWDDGTPTRYELVDGQPVAMNPPQTRHADIVEIVGRALERQLRPPCCVYRRAVGVARAEEGLHWRQPDIAVVCSRPDVGFFPDPRLVVEVLSPSTEKDDRTVKLDFYETFPTLKAILLVWQDERRVRLRERGADGWNDHDVIGSGSVALRDLGAELPLEEIYADPWAAEAV